MRNSWPLEALVRNSGRVVLTVAGIATIAGPIAADWNESHVFNQGWPSHARFHGVVALGTAAALSAFAVARLWLPFGDRAVRRDVAAAVPLAYWGSFFPAAVVRGTGLDDPPHPVGRIAGVPVNLFFATVTTVTAVGGWLLDRRLAEA
jgi:hypothetical protein